MSPRLPIGVLTTYRVPAAPALAAASAFAELTSRLPTDLAGLRCVLLELLGERRLADESDHLVDELAVLEEENSGD
jgi:hypothetical protein